MAKMLIDLGASTTHVNHANQTPLQWFQDEGEFPEVAAYLNTLQVTADPTLWNDMTMEYTEPGATSHAEELATMDGLSEESRTRIGQLMLRPDTEERDAELRQILFDGLSTFDSESDRNVRPRTT